MEYRYLDKLRTEQKMEDVDSQYIMVPKFILQPLVENCFTHGFKNCTKEFFLIRIFIGRESEGTIRIMIEDNGNGFSEEDLKRIEKDRALIHESIVNPNARFLNETTGVGLINTYARLLLQYKEGVELSVGKGELGGGLVVITCPEQTA